jgi:hypothetical protein
MDRRRDVAAVDKLESARSHARVPVFGSSNAGSRLQASLKVIARHTRPRRVASALGGASRSTVMAVQREQHVCGRHPYGSSPLLRDETAIWHSRQAAGSIAAKAMGDPSR